MSSLKGKFTRIQGRFSEARVLPRLGKIRLGVKVERTGPKGTVEFPRETEHFVCPPEVEAVYGPEPLELDVLLPSDDPEVVFQQKLVMYGSGAGVKCHGNGVEAERKNEQTQQFEPCVCPCPFLKTPENPRGQCTEKSSLMVILPMVSMGGCYQITTSSFHSTRNLNSSLDMTKAVAGRIALLPMKLRRVPQETHHDGKKQTHYVLNLVLNASWQQLADLRANPSSIVIPSQYQIEAPVDENPILDRPDIQELDAEALANSSDQELADIQAKLREQQAKHNGNGKHTVRGDGHELGKAVRESNAAKPIDCPVSQDAPAPKAEPKKLDLTKLIPQPEWESVVELIHWNPDYNDARMAWQAANEVDSIKKMTQGGQKAVITSLRTACPSFPY